MFFWSLAERDAREGRDCSRVFVPHGDEYPAPPRRRGRRREPTLRLNSSQTAPTGSSAVCDSAGVKPSKPALNARDFVTSGEPSFIEKHPVSEGGQPSGEAAKAAPKAETEEKAAEKPDFDKLMAELDSASSALRASSARCASLVNLIKVRKLRRGRRPALRAHEPAHGLHRQPRHRQNHRRAACSPGSTPPSARSGRDSSWRWTAPASLQATSARPRSRTSEVIKKAHRRRPVHRRGLLPRLRRRERLRPRGHRDAAQGHGGPS